MFEQTLSVCGQSILCYTLNTIIVGSGAAGLNAADRLFDLGQTDIALVTEGIHCGTSRNTGSDKQTYYKLTLSGGEPDSVREMAQNLYEGRAVDGDIALCEAALSAQCFLKLAELGVPFPRNRYGEYVGYKTDHDPRSRATSVGPYTSRKMTECLEAAVQRKSIRIFDGMLAIAILSDGQQAQGLLCLDQKQVCDPERRFAAFHCKNIVWATGGPAGMYSQSVYPLGQYGATGTAFAAGAMGKNLTEWQFGLASVNPRWNVSGTYMQVLPRFLSTKPDGSDTREFLLDFFPDESDMLSKIFLKGYQWPFDVRKVESGSSIIDILVDLEQKRGRRIFLDFTQNPCSHLPDFQALIPEARDYLKKAGACFGTPIERLLHMNAPAVSFYLDKGVDLAREPLEIALCAQHNNGGLSIDCWWQTNIRGLFAVGEAAASHGVYRPGGSALNAGQVGSTRAAQYIAARRCGAPDTAHFEATLSDHLQNADQLIQHTLRPDIPSNIDEVTRTAIASMSANAGPFRSAQNLSALLASIRCLYADFAQHVHIDSPNQLPKVFRLRDILLSQQVYVEAMLDYLHHGGQSRGSVLYTNPLGFHPHEKLSDQFTYHLEDKDSENLIQEVQWTNESCHFTWRSARPIPQGDDFFENVWRSYREDGNIS